MENFYHYNESKNLVVFAEVQLIFGSTTTEVANNSYVRAGNIPRPDGLLCASNTTNPTTRQWYRPNEVPVGTTSPTHGTYQSDTAGGVILHRVGDLDKDIVGVYYCNISDSSENTHTLYVGLYTGETAGSSTTSGRANGMDLILCMHVDFYGSF